MQVAARYTPVLMLAVVFSLQLILFESTGKAIGAEYEMREVLGNTVSNTSCKARGFAEALAKEPVELRSYGKTFCASLGHGWLFTELKSPGNTICESCEDVGYRCFQSDVHVTCRHLKSGSIGPQHKG